MKRCKDKRCKTCSINIIEGNSYFFEESKKRLKITDDINCDSSNIIRVIICSNCKKSYIGETGDTLKHRTTLHRQHIKNHQTAPLQVSKHLYLCNKGTFSIMPVFQYHKGETFRKLKESQLIAT